MKVLHLLSSNKFSGAENVVCQVIHMFADDDFDMAYCSPDGDIRKSLKERHVKYFPLTKLSVHNVKKIVRVFQPDIIHAHDIRASIIASRFSRKYKIISHVHGNHNNMNTLTLKSVLYLIASNTFSHTFWVSNSSREGYFFKKLLNPNKNSVLYNIIDINATRQKMSADSSEYDYDIVYLGRISHEKNPHRLVSVLKQCVQKNSSLKCAMIGTGPLEKEISALIEAESLSNNIKMLGFRANPLKILYDSKVMVMTSIYEGTPMCALEAMSLGVPIVSTKTDGMVDLIDDGKTGYLSDDDTVLCEKICDIIENKDLYCKLSTASAQKAEKIMNTEEYMSHIRKAYN